VPCETCKGKRYNRETLEVLFKGKSIADVLDMTVEEAAQFFAAVPTVRDKVEPLDDPAERLLTLVDSLFDCFEQNRDLLRIYTRSTGGLPWRLRHTMGDSSVAIFQRFTGWVVALSRQAQTVGYLRGLDAEVFSLTLIGSVTTTAAFAIERAPEEPLSRAAPAVRAICKRLLLGEAAG